MTVLFLTIDASLNAYMRADTDITCETWGLNPYKDDDNAGTSALEAE